MPGKGELVCLRGAGGAVWVAPNHVTAIDVNDDGMTVVWLSGGNFVLSVEPPAEVAVQVERLLGLEP